ncbi:MAG: hypothetical protein ACOC7R_00195 [Planctomycetota bacterium]
MTDTIAHHYDLTPAEKAEVEAIHESIAQRGRLYRTDRDGHPITDAAGQAVPAEYQVLRSRRFLVDADGIVWRFFAEGSSKNPDTPDRGGAPWRNNRVEMWTGRWRAVAGRDGHTTYAKVLVARPVDKRINGHPGMPQIQWYRTVKGYRHPHEGPREPSPEDIRRLRRGRGPTTAPQAPQPRAQATQASPQQQTSSGKHHGKHPKKDHAHAAQQNHGRPNRR